MSLRSTINRSRALSFAVSTAIATSLVTGCGAPAGDAPGQSSEHIDIRLAPGDSLASAINRASPGDRILVPAGTYPGGGWIEHSGTASAPITIVSADGPRRAVIEGGGESLRIGNSSYLVFDGFEVRNAGDNVVHIDSGSHHITLRNMYVHDAGDNGDVVKINQSNHITIERSEIARPGRRTDGGENPYQECLDFVDVDDSAVRDNFIHDAGSMLMFVKGGSRNTVIERNVYSGQRAGASDPMVGLGGPTDIELLDGEQFEVINVVFRNNVVMNGLVGAVAVYDAQGAYIANNLMVDNDRVLVEFRAGNGPAARSENVQIADNVMVDTRGRMPTPLMRSSHGLSGLAVTHNAWWNAGGAIPTTDLLDLASEAGHLTADPLVGAASASAGRDAILSAVRPRAGSPLAGSGSDTSASPFGVTDDIMQTARGGAHDRGPFALGASSGSTAPAPAPAPAPTPAPVPTTEPAPEPAPEVPTATWGDTASTPGGTCGHETTTPDDRGIPVGDESGHIRFCFPGEDHCYCDQDDDCYAEEGYVACQ